MFTVPIDGGIQVSSATTATALVDLSPTVVLLSGQSGPGFLFTPEAVGYVVPSDQIPATSPGQHVGGRINLTNLKWWEKILEEQAKFAITGLALQPSSLTIQAVNGGNVSVLFSIVALSSQFSVNGGDSQLIAVSQMFVVEPNATLVAVNRGSTDSQILKLIVGGGYLLAPGKSVTFTYTGPIQIGGLRRNSQPTLISAGQTYLVSLEGNGRFARGATVAQPGTTILPSTTTITTTSQTTTTHSSTSKSTHTHTTRTTRTSTTSSQTTVSSSSTSTT
jgi:hypothetical protein